MSRLRKLFISTKVLFALSVLSSNTMAHAQFYDNSFEAQRKRNTEQQKRSTELSRLQRAAEDELRDKNYEEALRFAEEGLVFRKTMPESINDAGQLAIVKAKALEGLGKPEEAIRTLEAPREIYSDSFDVIQTLVDMLMARKRFEEAMQQVERVRDRYPDDTQKLMLLSHVLETKGDLERAVRTLQKAYKMREARKMETSDIRQELYKLGADAPGD